MKLAGGGHFLNLQPVVGAHRSANPPRMRSGCPSHHAEAADLAADSVSTVRSSRVCALVEVLHAAQAAALRCWAWFDVTVDRDGTMGGLRAEERRPREFPTGACPAAAPPPHRIGPRCGVASAKGVDALVEKLVLGVIDQGAVDLALAYDERQREEEARLDRQWQQQLQRLEYECALAQTPL
jgi:hypothetical protein